MRNVTVHSPHGLNTALNVSWLAPVVLNGVIIAYEVNVSAQPFENITASGRHAVIKGLGTSTLSALVLMSLFLFFSTAPFVPYSVSVAAYTEAGRGPYSNPVINFTEQGCEWKILILKNHYNSKL